MSAKKNPRPPKRGPLMTAPHVNCPKCEEPLAYPFIGEYGVAPQLGQERVCRCGATCKLVELRVQFQWAWEVVRP